MNCTKSGSLLAALLLMLSTGLQAADVTITVNGRVVAKPCTVSVTNANVDLGNLYTYNLASAGDKTVWHDVSLELTNCPVGTSKVTATFTGISDSTGYYVNQGSAGNIYLELQDRNASTKTIQVNDSTQAATFPLQVRAITVNGGATQGSIQAVINVTYTWA